MKSSYKHACIRKYLSVYHIYGRIATEIETKVFYSKRFLNISALLPGFASYDHFYTATYALQ